MFKASYRFVKSYVDKATNENLTVDSCWPNAFGATILSVIWHLCNNECMLRIVPAVLINMQGFRKTGMHIWVLLKEILKTIDIIVLDNVSVYTATTDNKAAAYLSVDFLTNFVGLVRCVVHLLALCVNDVFRVGAVWEHLMSCTNDVTINLTNSKKLHRCTTRTGV